MMTLLKAMGYDGPMDPARLALSIQMADAILESTNGDAERSLAFAFKVAQAIRASHDSPGDDEPAGAC